MVKKLKANQESEALPSSPFSKASIYASTVNISSTKMMRIMENATVIMQYWARWTHFLKDLSRSADPEQVSLYVSRMRRAIYKIIQL